MQSRMASLPPTPTAAESPIVPLLESRTFSRAPALRALLQYLWEHRDEELSEFAIATEALGRKSDFDPKTDATVRVQISRVRQKLKEYYDDEGAGAALRISLPLGSHQFQIEASDKRIQAAPRIDRKQIVLFVLLVAALALAGTLYLRLRAVETAQSPVQPPALPAFWQGFIANGKPVRIVLPIPAFFRWHQHTIKVRDTDVASFEEIEKSPGMRNLIRQWGTPEIMHNYGILPDAFAALRFTALLAAAQVPVSAVTHREAMTDAPGEFNRIYLANARTGGHLADLVGKLNFQPNPSDFSFLNRNPVPGEPERYELVQESRRRDRVPALLAVFEGEGGSRSLVLTSENVAVLGEYLTNPDSLRQIEDLRQSCKCAGSFELLVIGEIDSGRVIQVKPAAIRPVPANPE
jgi:hypothetical protein